MIDWRKPDYLPVFQQRAAVLAELRADPVKLAAFKVHYKANPANFINDWMTTFDPRNPEIGLPAVVPFLLFPRQREAIEWLRERWLNREDGLVEKSRDMGLSWLSVAFAIWAWTFYDGVVVGFGSRKEEYVDKLGDPKSLFWKARQVIQLLPDVFTPAGYNEQKHAPYMRILNPENGSSIIGEAGDNIGRGARTSLYLKDESAFYERPETIDAALSQTSNCKIDISTPNGSGNPFFRKRHGGKLPVFTFHWRDDPRKDAAWYTKQCETLDPHVVAQEIDINYEASVTDGFIPGELVDAAMSDRPYPLEALGPLQFGVDVARYGDDKSVLTARRGRVVIAEWEWAKLSLTDVAGRMRNEIRAFRETPAQIAVDVVGLGAGVCDMLRDWFGDCVIGVESGARVSDGVNYNVRAQMWDNLRDWLQNGPVQLPNDRDLKAELCALRYKFNTTGERLIESKEDAKKRGVKSPNRADALALTFAQPPANLHALSAFGRASKPADAYAGY